MNRFLKVIIILAVSIIAFLLFIFLFLGLALRPHYSEYQSTISGIAISKVRPHDYSYPTEIKQSDDSTLPLVIRLSLNIKDSLLSDKRKWSINALIPMAQATVDPGFNANYRFSDSVLSLRLYMINLDDTLDCSSDFRFLVEAPPGYTSKDTILCNSEKINYLIMNKISDFESRSTSFLLVGLKKNETKFQACFCELAMKSGIKFTARHEFK